MRYWVWSVSQANWEILKDRKVWATRDKNTTQKIKNGDILIFYVKGTLCFKGIFQVLDDWYETDEIIWADEIKEHKKKHRYQINVKTIQLGEANYNDLFPKLNFVEKKNFLKYISMAFVVDQLILEDLSRSRIINLF